ncbi:MAG: cupin domain-containing protein [Thermomicrobiales bacterium]|nr:cupin domain-containing protein [Thermomicrobiales bacterium]
MSENPMPRPAFAGPSHVRAGAGVRYRWGDEISGEVSVEMLVWSDQLHCGLFSMPVGARFGHSDAYPTVTAADEVWITLAGSYIMSCPATGEVHRVHRDEGVLSRPGTWHHGYSVGDEPLLMIEFLGGLGQNQADIKTFAASVPPPEQPRHAQDEWIGRWPEAREEAEQANRLQVVRPSEALLRIEGDKNPILVEVLASTPRLTVGRMRLLPGQRSDDQVHGGDEHLYVVSGTANIRLPQHEASQWHELGAGDSFFIPEGAVHHYVNETSAPVDLIFGVAPHYLPI